MLPKLETDLATARAELHQALIREKPIKQSRTILSKPRYIAQADSEEGAPCTGGAIQRSRPGQQGIDQSDAVPADGSEMEGQVDEVEQLEEVGVGVRVRRRNYRMKRRRAMRGFH